MNRLAKILSGLITIVLPIFLLMTAIRLMISPLFLEIEYRTPAFPPDVYGFTQTDRLYWSRFAVDYLVNNAGIEYLGDLRFPDGSPLYNERELGHMVDVKNLVQAMIQAWWVLLALLLGLGVWAWRAGWLADYWAGLARGGWLTLGLVIFILAAVMVSFSALFTQFHRIFFTGDTWIFEWSDTLIRLFPMRFWRDAFIMVGMVTVSGALLSSYLGRRWAARAEQR